MSRTNLTRVPACAACKTPTDELDEYGECFDCSDVVEPTLDFDRICYECGDDVGPYDGLCLDCLEESEGG